MAVDVPYPGDPPGPVLGWPDAGERGTHARLIAVQEAERARIARELHDVVGQALTAVRLSLLALDRVHATTGASGEIGDSIATIDAALHQVRTVAFDLRPPILDDLGLPAALRSICRGVAGRAGVQARVVNRIGDARFERDVETACFRIAQEAITNVVRHAAATRVVVRLSLNRRRRFLVLEILDDGVGFDPAICVGDRCVGILGMRERATLAGGIVEVAAAPGGGTRLVARFARDGSGEGPRP